MTLFAYVAATGLVSAMCYWEGRHWVENGLGFTPGAWTASIAPVHGVLFALGAGWAGFWFVRTMKFHRTGRDIAHAVAPMAMFWLSAAQAWRMSYSCNLF